MKSIDKLKRLTGEDKAPKKTEPVQPDSASSSERQSQLADLRGRIENVVTRGALRTRAAQEEARARGNRALCELLEGEEIENRHGRFFLAGGFLSGVSRHGHRSICEAFNFDMTAAGMLANNPVLGAYHPSDALFLDTETTGLSGGTGTMAFLIGLGWFEEGRFHIRQILARDFGEEPAALACLQEIAAQKKFLVTFNGKAFDVNLLATRFILNRMQSSLHELPHLDLLHPSRRLLGHRLENCRLATLEADILGVEREGDIPGWEIPQRYFDWLRRRDPRLLADIFNTTAGRDFDGDADRSGRSSNAQALQQLRILTLPAAAGFCSRRGGRLQIFEILGENACAAFLILKRTWRISANAPPHGRSRRIWRRMRLRPERFYAVTGLPST